MNAPTEDVEMTSGEAEKSDEVVIELPQPVAPTDEVSSALAALESLAPVSSPVTQVLENHILAAKQRLASGEDVKTIILELQKALVKSKKDVEKGLKDWYGHLGKIGKQVDKVSCRGRLRAASTDRESGFSRSVEYNISSLRPTDAAVQ